MNRKLAPVVEVCGNINIKAGSLRPVNTEKKPASSSRYLRKIPPVVFSRTGIVIVSVTLSRTDFYKGLVALRGSLSSAVVLEPIREEEIIRARSDGSPLVYTSGPMQSIR